MGLLGCSVLTVKEEVGRDVGYESSAVSTPFCYRPKSIIHRYTHTQPAGNFKAHVDDDWALGNDSLHPPVPHLASLLFDMEGLWWLPTCHRT